MTQQLRERVQRQLTQALTLRQKPFLERRFPKRQVVEQISAVESQGASERIRRGLSHLPLELEDVDFDRRRVQRDTVAIDQEHCRPSTESPKRRKRLA